MTKSEYRELVEFIAPQFDGISKRFGAMDGRFDAMDDRLRRVEVLGEDNRRGGRPVARLVPVPRGGRLGDLPALLEAVPRLSIEDAEALAWDVQDARDSVPALPDGDPWES